MVEEVNTRGSRECQRTKIFPVMLLIFLLLLVGTDTRRAMSQGATTVLEATESACSLKKDDSDCAVGSNERVRDLRPGTTTEEDIAGKERHLYKITLSSGQFL